jgi:hypothetical protein
VKRGLMLWFALVLVVMVGLTTWASLHENVVRAFVRLAQDPWGLATLADAYFAFLTFWLWVAWKEGRWVPSLAWLVAILLLGNLAIAAYVMIELLRSPDLKTLMARRKPWSI